MQARVPQVAGFARWPHERSAKQAGKALRERLPRSAFGRPEEWTWQRRGDGAGTRRAASAAVAAVEESNTGRIPGLVPLRVGRMAASPFAFLRGSAGLMAADLDG